MRAQSWTFILCQALVGRLSPIKNPPSGNILMQNRRRARAIAIAKTEAAASLKLKLFAVAVCATAALMALTTVW